MAKVFIDGKAGTTGLQIYEMLKSRDDIDLLVINEDQRKNPSARERLLNSSDLTILCLPDDAALEAVALANQNTRIIDASTAHRTDDNWTYGLPELSLEYKALIAEAKHVSNPGCYPQGFILLIKPLIDAGLIDSQASLFCSAVSGYSGGGRQMIESFESKNFDAREKIAVQDYALDLQHKHLPEMTKYSGLEKDPIFLPSVANYYKGMIIRIPIMVDLLNQSSPDDVVACLKARYTGSKFIRVCDFNENSHLESGRLAPTNCNDTNFMDLMIFGKATQMVLIARYDNLGKGAAGAAVQNLNIMLGKPEATGL